MNCPNCGKEIAEGSLICQYCNKVLDYHNPPPLDIAGKISSQPPTIPSTLEKPNLDSASQTIEKEPFATNTITANEAMICVPWSSTYIKSVFKNPSPAPENSTLWIDFPRKCLWCGSEHIVGYRVVYLACNNPKYVPLANRTLQKAGAFTGAVIASALGANAIGQVLTFQTLSPEKLSEIEYFYLNGQVPYCEQHVLTDSQNVFRLLGPANNFHGFMIQVRDADFAEEIARISFEKRKAEAKISEISANLKNKSMTFSSLEGLSWPDNCVLCCKPHPTHKYEVKAGEQYINVSVCEKHGQKSLYKKLENSNLIFILILGFLLLGLGIATFWLNMETGSHIALCVCGFPILLTAIMALGRTIISQILIGIPSGFEDIKGPMEIKFKDGKYKLIFLNKKVADEMYRLNKDKVV
jgi:hypothetical protein